MFSAEILSTANRRTITPDECRQMKRRLFDLRCRHAKLLRSHASRQAIRKTERRIMQIELELARSDIVFPEEGPITLGELAYRVKAAWSKVANAVVSSFVVTRTFIASYRPLPEHRARKLKLS